MAPGAGSKFAASKFEPEIFRKQMYCTEESTSDIVGTSLRPLQSFTVSRSDLAPPLWFSARGIVPHSLRPCLASDHNVVSAQEKNSSADVL